MPQVEELKYARVGLMSKAKMAHLNNRWIGALLSAIQTLYQTVVGQKELSQKAKVSMYWLAFVKTLTYGRKLWVMTQLILVTTSGLILRGREWGAQTSKGSSV